MPLRCLTAFLVLFFSHPVYSQFALPDSSKSAPVTTATATFLNALQNEKEIYNGPEHVDYLRTIEGLPYFFSKDWQTGSVAYDGLIYPNEALLYDLVKDQLVVLRPDRFAIELRKDKVDWFRIAGHLFVYIPQENNLGLSAGFYDQLAGGSLTVLVKRWKVYEDHVEETNAHRLFVDKIEYYAVQNNKVHVIRKLHSLLALTGKRSNEIQQQLRRAGIRFKENHEAALAAAARYYNQIQP